jgi:hypothetical protein
MKHYAIKTCGELDVLIHNFLTLSVAGGEWSPSRPDRFTLGKEPLVPIVQEVVSYAVIL